MVDRRGEPVDGSGEIRATPDVATDRDTGRPRGFGFVEMGCSQDADGAIRELNGYDFGGRALTVNEAKERTAGGGGGGFGGGYGGGGGRSGGGGGRRY